MAAPLCFSSKLFSKKFAVGVDADSSSIKIAYTTTTADNLEFKLATFATTDYVQAAQLIAKLIDENTDETAEICMLGNTGNNFKEELNRTCSAEIRSMTSDVGSIIASFRFLSERVPWDDFVRMPSANALQAGYNEANSWKGISKPMAAADERMILLDSMKDGKSFEIPVVSKGLTYPVILCLGDSSPSIIEVYEDGQYKLRHGNPIGGKTYLGLGHIFTEAKNLEELNRFADTGDYGNVHQLLDDVFVESSDGDAYGQFDTKSKYSVFEFSKLDDSDGKVAKEDLAAALRSSITRNMALYAYLWASILNVKQVFFVGGFPSSSDAVRNLLTPEYIKQCMSNTEITSSDHYFVQLGSHLGAIGAMLNILK